jgi:hypothetical protein
VDRWSARGGPGALLPEPLAEAILAEHRSELERQGFGDSWGVTKGELTVRPERDSNARPTA